MVVLKLTPMQSIFFFCQNKVPYGILARFVLYQLGQLVLRALCLDSFWFGTNYLTFSNSAPVPSNFVFDHIGRYVKLNYINIFTLNFVIHTIILGEQVLPTSIVDGPVTQPEITAEQNVKAEHFAVTFIAFDL